MVLMLWCRSCCVVKLKQLEQSCSSNRLLLPPLAPARCRCICAHGLPLRMNDLHHTAQRSARVMARRRVLHGTAASTLAGLHHASQETPSKICCMPPALIAHEAAVQAAGEGLLLHAAWPGLAWPRTLTRAS